MDLTYTSPPPHRIITHGFPSAGLEHLYRNPRAEIARFLDTKHLDHYKVYNLCCEPGRGYDPKIFHGRVERYPFRDHCVPPLETMVQLGESAKQWLDADEANVVALHCKAGKGRAGIMTCVMLLRAGYFETAGEAMDFYDQTRVSNYKGLTVRSQRKFVKLYERLWREHWHVEENLGNMPANPTRRLPEQPVRTLVAVRVVNPGQMQISDQFVCQVLSGTWHNPEVLFTTNLSRKTDENGKVFQWDVHAQVEANFAVVIKTSSGCCKKKFFNMWENTAFLNTTAGVATYPFAELDFKKKYRKRVSEAMTLELIFDECESSQSTTSTTLTAISEIELGRL